MPSITLNTDGSGTAMKDILPYVRTILGYPNADATRDAALAMLAEVAMGEYNAMAPRIPPHYNFTTVQNQQNYPMPVDLKTVTDVFTPSQYGYYNDTLFLPMIDTPSSSLFGYSDYAFRSPSERIIRSGILGELDHYATSFVGYKVEQGTPPQLWLFPSTVASGLNVIVRYTADHLNTSSDATAPSWNTLPAGHWRLIIDLMRAAVLMQRAQMLLSSMNMTDGGNRTSMVSSWQTNNTAQRIIQEVRMKLGADQTVAIRS